VIVRPQDVRPGDMIEVSDHNLFRDMSLPSTARQRRQAILVIASATEMRDPRHSNEVTCLDEPGELCHEIEIGLASCGRIAKCDG